MTCKKSNRSKATNSGTKVKNFVKELLRKWASSKKQFSLVSISMDNGKALWAIAFSIALLAGSQFYAAHKGIQAGNFTSNVTIECSEVKGK